MKNIKHLKIGRSIPRIEVNKPADYVYARPENKRPPFAERIVDAFGRYRPDIPVQVKGPGLCFYQYKIKLLPNEARYNNSVHPFETTTELLEDLNDNGIINLSKSDICYISKFTDKN